MYKILYYVLWRVNRLMCYANALREFVSGNRQQERVESIRDLLGVIPMKYKGMREQGQAGWAFEPLLRVCGSDTYDRSKNGGLGRKSVRLQCSSGTILTSSMEECQVKQRWPSSGTHAMLSHQLELPVSQTLFQTLKMLQLEAIAWLHSLWLFPLEGSSNGFICMAAPELVL